MADSKHKPAQIRWLIRRDWPELLAIERDSFEFAWTEYDLASCMRQHNCIGMVAEHDQQIVGFMVYELHKTTIHILNFAVSRAHRRRGIGHQMVTRLIDKLSQQRRNEIYLEVRETNLQAQLFFASQGFRALQILRNHYDSTTEDAYYMSYRLGCLDKSCQHMPRNRIAEYDGF